MGTTEIHVEPEPRPAFTTDFGGQKRRIPLPRGFMRPPAKGNDTDVWIMGLYWALYSFSINNRDQRPTVNVVRRATDVAVGRHALDVDGDWWVASIEPNDGIVSGEKAQHFFYSDFCCGGAVAKKKLEALGRDLLTNAPSPPGAIIN